MSFTPEQLAAPFPPERVSWRVGSTTGDKTKGMALAFIDARDVMERLDAVCGPAGWQNRYPHANGKTVCEIGIKIGDEWVWKADGAGDTDVEAEKGALSDAFKRAAVRWGIGRYLYDLPSPWVKLEAAGRTYKIADEEHAKLRAILRSHAGQGATVESPSPRRTWAISQLKATATPEALKTFWEANKDALKEGLETPDYAAVVEVMRARAADLQGGRLN